MKKILIVLFTTICFSLGGVSPTMAGGLFSKRDVGNLLKGVILNKVYQSERNRQRRHKEADRNSTDLKRNRAKIEMQKERDEYARQKQLDDLRFQKELERERKYGKKKDIRNCANNDEDDCGLDDEYGVIIIYDPSGRYKVDGYDGIFTSQKSAERYADSLFPGKKVAKFIQKVDNVDIPLNSY